MLLRRLAISVLCAAALLVPTAAAQTPSETLGVRLETALKEPGIPAMTVLVIRNGKVAEQAVRGVRAAGGPDPARLDDTWHIGSDAKAMTAAMIARLVERGTLSWTMPLSRLLPDTPMRPEFRDVTLPDLLSHRAGLRDLDDIVDAKLLDAAFADTRPLAVQRQAFVRTVLNEAPIGPARGQSSYSNSGYVIAAAVAERATGKPFETLIREEVFQPLGMTVDFTASRRGQVLGHKAGKPLTGLRSDNPPFIAPAGRLRLTMTDWAKFAIDQMAGETGRGKLLKPETYRFLHTPQGQTDAALGWGVRTTWPKDAPIRMLSHSGSNGYWNALIALAPDKQSGVLIVANAAEGEVEKVETGVLLELMRGIAAAP